MSNIRISQLPTAPSAITGAELVPIVQNGQTVQTTITNIVNSPVQTQTFLTVGAQASLPNSRYIGGGLGIGTSDGGVQGVYSLFLNGTSASLENASTGIIVKSAVNTVVNRSIAVGTAGLSVSDGSGVSGNPTFSLTGLALSAATLSGNGMVSLVGGSYFQNVTLTGTSDQIDIANPNGGSNPTFSIANNPVLPGAASVQIPSGATGDRPALPVVGDIRYNSTTSRYEGYITSSWQNFGLGDGSVTSVSGTANQIAVANGSTTPVISIVSNPTIPGLSAVTLPKGATSDRTGSPAVGMIRYNTDTGLFEGYSSSAWVSFASGSGVTSVATGTGLTGGPITSTGTISIANTTVVAGTYGSSSEVPSYTVNAQGQLTAAANISISATSIGAVTSVTGTANEITSSGGQTPVISLPSAITLTGKTIAGGSYNMTAASVASDVVTTNTAAQTLTNKTISGANNTLSNIANSSLTNSSVTVGTTAISLGASSLTLGGLTSVAVTQDPTTAFELATKQYVDTATSTGLTYHQPVQAATTAALTGVVTYNNGTAGVGATLTLGTPLTVLDGYTLVNTNRILIKDQANQIQNGVYTWATGGTILTRATDADTYGSGTNQLSLNDYFFVQNGTVNKGVSYVLSAPAGTITFGTSNIQFAEFSTSQVYTGTAPIDITGTVISLTTVPATLGGTGQSSYAVGNLLYASSTTALSKLGIGTNSQVLKSNGTTPYWDLNPTYLPVVLHSGSTTNIPVGSGYLPVLLHDGVTTSNVALF